MLCLLNFIMLCFCFCFFKDMHYNTMIHTFCILKKMTFSAFLKTRLKETIHKAFSHRNYGSKCVVLGYNSTYFSNNIQKGKACYYEDQVISMLEFLIDNIVVSVGGTVSAGRRHTNGYELCPFSSRFIFILI